MNPWLEFAAIALGIMAARALLDLAVWLWHRRKGDPAADRHRELEGWIAVVTEDVEALLANSADQGGRHGVTGQTGYMPPVLTDAQLADLHAAFAAAHDTAINQVDRIASPVGLIAAAVEPYPPIIRRMP